MPKIGSASVAISTDGQTMETPAHNLNSTDSEKHGPKLPFRSAFPAEQPDSVHELTDALYAPFRLQNGSIHLSGCSIDSIPIVETSDHKYCLLNGEILSDRFAKSLGVQNIVESSEIPLVRNNAEQIASIRLELEKLADIQKLQTDSDNLVTLIWCHHVKGQVAVEFGDSTAYIAFSLWGKRLIDGLEQCPPYHCELTGSDSYRLGCDDDGTITDIESIRTCPESGRRLIINKFGKCQITNTLVDPAFLFQCPVSRRTILKRLAKQCRRCQQDVDPAAMRRRQCKACRDIKRVSPTDPRSQRIVEAFPKLAENRRWKMGEQSDFLIIEVQDVARSWTILVDHQTLKPALVVGRTGWFGPWKLAEASDWPDYVKSAGST